MDLSKIVKTIIFLINYSYKINSSDILSEDDLIASDDEEG